ncbi:orotidine-5'-phosphate decarboxylase [Aureobasidium namibiae CBS 147.97]|uniref:Orotidine 5'-phosphate decarboxylase n=1 Tax=Aureobasidium namibiae CBS 147.97 TaxID=1043004 RepID=A0A074WWQ4_9PEZI|nr:orotidine-5'-phosphate decarboxylase [Aureobasidium namibiae CBS 147.97]KEQ77630.1 orotidine-5'-phosphate decarboxylase [Aureobasidium namibiae CBS 147.97]
MARHATITQSYQERASLPNTSPVASYLLRLIATKQTNLCVSADVSTTRELLQLAEEVGDSICMLKTHADIINDFGPRTIQGLKEIAAKKHFLIFEDRKFGDIGSTVQKQFTAGPLQIVRWANIINAHIFPGPAIITALSQAAHKPPLLRSLLILAEMSSAGNLMTGSYTEQCVVEARKNPEFVMGFIAQRSLNEQPGDNFVTMTPGVQIGATGDGLGQQYNTPEQVIIEAGTDIIIVGRGVYGAQDKRAKAEEYRVRAWKAYEERIGPASAAKATR